MATTQPGPTAVPLRRIADLPGPPGLPLLGNLHQIDRERMHQQLEDWSRTYGRLFRFRIGAREFVVASDPADIGAILRNRPDVFQRTDRLTDIARSLGFGGLFSSNGADWRRQRPMVLAGLDPTHIKAYFPTLKKVTERFARRWQRAALAGAAIDLQADLMRYTVDVTAGLAFGVDINTIESDTVTIQAHLDKIFPALFRRLMAPLPYWHYLRLPAERALEKHLAALQSAVDGFIAAAQRRLDAQPGLRERPTNLIEAMLAARERDGSGITDADVSGNVLTMLLAGEDTTANTLAWMIWLLHRNPDAVPAIVEELQATLGDETLPSSLDQLQRLDLLEACAHETMRLKPVAPINTTQVVRGTAIAGVALPAGTLVMCLMRPAAVDEAHFADAAAFRPQRWREAAPRGAGAAAHSAKRVAMPFGAGPRICPGRFLALAEIKMLAAMLFSTFEIADVAAPGGGDARERIALTMSPVGLKLKLRLRDRVADAARRAAA